MKKATKLFTGACLIGAFFFFGCGSGIGDLTDGLEELKDAAEEIEDAAEEYEDEVKTATGEKFFHEDGKFKINFPGEPEISTQTQPTQAGDIEITMFMYEKSATEVYMVSYNDYPSAVMEQGGSIEDMLDGAVNGYVSTIGGSVEEQESITLNGNKGIYVKAKSDQYYVVLKDYVVGNRLYQVGIMRDGSYPTEKAIDSFINSFELVD